MVMSDDLEMPVTYQVFVTKTARRQGEKLPISRGSKKEIIEQLKRLKYWLLATADEFR